MLIFNSRNKNAQKKIGELNDILDNYNISKSLDVNVMAIKKLFEDDDTMITRSIVNNHDSSLQFCIAYCQGVSDSFMINEDIIKPLILSKIDFSKENLIDGLINQVLLVSEIKKISNMTEVIKDITYGHTVIFIDKIDRALILNTKGFETRSITEPDTEKTLSGPREGFNECLITNLSLIHRKLRTNDLKMRFINFGDRTNTQACVCYMDSLVNTKILNELYQRLDKIDIDGVLDVNYINELIKDAPFSLFRTTGFSERPDVIVGKMLEGRIALIVDGSPTVMTVPYLFIENFQNGEDYYMNFFYTSFTRMIRLLGFVLTLTVPAFFIAVVAFHHEMLPTTLFVNIAMERQSSPLPAAVEAFILLILFDILKETGIRMPTNIGQALSIVGALVIGQAAVEAKLVAAPMIIVVAATGITGLLIPRMNGPVIIIRFIFLILASILGFYGLIIGISWLIIHLLSLRSFGVPQMISSGNLRYQDIKDKAFRAPWWQMILRPRMITSDRKRMKRDEKKQND